MEKLRALNQHVSQLRPNVFEYQEYRTFLKDWFEYARALDPSFSVRKLSKAANIANGYITMVLNGKRKLSDFSLRKLWTHLDLRDDELSYLALLIPLCDAREQPQKLTALKRLRKFREHQKLSLKDMESYHYLEAWHRVAIRELANTDGFKLDPVWIKERLRSEASLEQIQESINFLITNGYLEENNGKVTRSKKELNCFGGIYRIAMRKFHQKMIELSSKALDVFPISKRSVSGYTVALTPAKYREIQEILNDALSKIAEATKDLDRPSGAEVYHVSLSLFPLTESKEGEGK